MLTLSELQAHFQSYLMQGNIKEILPSVAPDTRLPSSKRLQIYFDAYRIRLSEILKLDFPKTHTLLGDHHFDEAFFQYLIKHPSTHFSVRYFGQYFSEFLGETTPFKDFTIFKEMAQFEWAVSSTLDAKEGPVINTALLAGVAADDWPNLQFEFHPSVVSHYFEWDTPQLWQDIENEAPQRQPVLQGAPIRWLFWRKGIRSFFLSCSAQEDVIFQAILQKNNFGEICEKLMDVIPEDQISLIVAQTLFKWVNEEMFSQVQ